MSDFPESEEFVEVVDTFGRQAGYIDVIMPVVLVAFAAFGIWLALRTLNRRERWAKWTALVWMLLGYPLSIGPAWWFSQRIGNPEWMRESLDFVYTPLWTVLLYCPEWLFGEFVAYCMVPSPPAALN
jgi:hypothetical protein